MTGGWAATNTLREMLWSGSALGDDNTCFGCGGRYSLGHREDCEAPAALALVETALDAADDVLAWKGPKFRSEYHDRLDALAAALRAVREGE